MRQLGNSTVHISPVLLGTWAIGGVMWGGTNEKDSIEAIQTSLDNGVTTIDTAAVYGFGVSEELVGKALKGRRDKAIIATKCGMRWLNNENPIVVKKNSKPESLYYECEESLRRLQTDRIDLYQIHWPDPDIPIEESWEAMATLKKQGKVRAIGVSNYNLEQLKQAHVLHPVDSIQLPYSLIRRSIEQDIIPFCQKNKIAVLAYSPLERGILTGKVLPDRQFPKEDHRSSYDLFSLENRKCIMRALEQVAPIAKTHDATLAQLIIACTTSIPGITGVLAGARNKMQALENAKSLKLQLSLKEQQLIIKSFENKELQR